jgi:hypothetical protein
MEYLREVNGDLDLFNSFYTEPLLLKKPDFPHIKEMIADLLFNA